MGQYYKAMLVDNEWEVKVVEPSGCKLMEHSWYWNESMRRIEALLYRQAKNVMWIWDYSQIACVCWKHKFKDEEDAYNEEYTDTDLLAINVDYDYFLVNEFTHEYINMTRQQMNKELQDWYWTVVHPLPLLCRAETEEAGWDYHSDINKEYIWIWCWDVISVSAWERTAMEKALAERNYVDKTDIYFFKE